MRIKCMVCLTKAASFWSPLNAFIGVFEVNWRDKKLAERSTEKNDVLKKNDVAVQTAKISVLRKILGF